MHITLESDYAVRIVYCLAQNGGRMEAAAIAEQTGVTLRFSLKILRKLAGSGIVCAQKGASGGYSLAMDPRDISLGLIIESIDGPFELNHCLNEEYDCTRVKDKRVCQFHHIFDELNAKLKKELYRQML